MVGFGLSNLPSWDVAIQMFMFIYLSLHVEQPVLVSLILSKMMSDWVSQNCPWAGLELWGNVFCLGGGGSPHPAGTHWELTQFIKIYLSGCLISKYCHIPAKNRVGCIIGFDKLKPKPWPYISTYSTQLLVFTCFCSKCCEPWQFKGSWLKYIHYT